MSCFWARKKKSSERPEEKVPGGGGFSQMPSWKGTTIGKNHESSSHTSLRLVEGFWGPNISKNQGVQGSLGGCSVFFIFYFSGTGG